MENNLNHNLIESLLIPICDDSPCGDYIRYEPEYDKLVAARQDDDETLPTGVWQSELHKADWGEVEKLASELLRTRSKDLIIIGWLGEAWIRQRGLIALEDAIQLITLAAERYPDTLHPQIKDGDHEFRAIPLSWINTQYTLLTETSPFLLVDKKPISYRDWQLNSQVSARVSNPEQLLASLNSSLTWMSRLNTWCDEHIGNTAPSFHTLEHKVKECLQTLASFCPHTTDHQDDDTPHDLKPTENAIFASRENAYRTVQQIADYLAKLEPHSPVPYILRRAVIWGNTPLPDLLNEILNEDDTARKLWKKMGVLP